MATQTSKYARVFDESNPNWHPNKIHRDMFLRTAQSYLNDRLKVRGRLFLNEVYEHLGFEYIDEGQTVGWRSLGSGKSQGDGYVKFKISDGHRPTIDFNVEGEILKTTKE